MIRYEVKCYLTLCGKSGTFPRAMTRPLVQDKGNWNLREVPRDLMRKVKMAAAHEGKSVKEFLMELAQERIGELERRGILPKGKG